jgi:hypothetical protein
LLGYLLIHLYAIAILVSIPLIYFGAVSLIFKRVVKRHSRKIKTIYITVALAAPSIWLASGYISFRYECNVSEGPKFYSIIPNVEGFHVKGLHISGGVMTTSVSQAPQKLIESGAYRCLETDINGYHVKTTYSKENGIERKQIKFGEEKPFCANYAFEVLPPKPKSIFLKPFHSSLDIVIYNISNGETIANATEHLYGGGIMSIYLKYLASIEGAGSYLACGYTSKKPHKWRWNKESTTQYITTDSEFIKTALEPANYGK